MTLDFKKQTYTMTCDKKLVGTKKIIDGLKIVPFCKFIYRNNKIQMTLH